MEHEAASRQHGRMTVQPCVAVRNRSPHFFEVVPLRDVARRHCSSATSAPSASKATGARNNINAIHAKVCLSTLRAFVETDLGKSHESHSRIPSPISSTPRSSPSVVAHKSIQDTDSGIQTSRSVQRNTQSRAYIKEAPRKLVKKTSSPTRVRPWSNVHNRRPTPAIISAPIAVEHSLALSESSNWSILADTSLSSSASSQSALRGHAKSASADSSLSSSLSSVTLRRMLDSSRSLAAHTRSYSRTGTFSTFLSVDADNAAMDKTLVEMPPVQHGKINAPTFKPLHAVDVDSALDRPDSFRSKRRHAIWSRDLFVPDTDHDNNDSATCGKAEDLTPASLDTPILVTPVPRSPPLFALDDHYARSQVSLTSIYSQASVHAIDDALSAHASSNSLASSFARLNPSESLSSLFSRASNFLDDDHSVKSEGHSSLRPPPRSVLLPRYPCPPLQVSVAPLSIPKKASSAVSRAQRPSFSVSSGHCPIISQLLEEVECVMMEWMEMQVEMVQ
ncbi:hypothetical protein FISHEDRAFT_70371 [Fistulina hepatica ATCC 64428]|uniref:Uncharacterized protein n=1 Tax=Fistulina hepatica ATCC 64428 TaxID=1128425 RepID=A0A0D7AM69_9AGAR|nr:hypothetical protein FISHEDRAFT_70371 [Fistulina hepatica ATCC 64428]